MGKIYKNPTPTPIKTTTPIPSKPTPFVLPTAQVLPLDQFDLIFNLAQSLIEKNNYRAGLPHLLNLEITDFHNMRVHELLADTFLQLNQIPLAKEQLQIYAQLLKESFATEFAEYSTENSTSDSSSLNNPELEILALKSFDQLLEEAGDFNELTEKAQELDTEDITESNFHQGTKVVLKLATHYIAQKKYQEAESLLTTYRDRYLHFLDQEEELG